MKRERLEYLAIEYFIYWNSTTQNSKNSKPFESSKKRPNLDQKTLPKSNNHENNQQKRRQPSKTPSFISFFRPLFSSFPTTICIEIKKLKTIKKKIKNCKELPRHFGALLAPALKLGF